MPLLILQVSGVVVFVKFSAKMEPIVGPCAMANQSEHPKPYIQRLPATNAHRFVDQAIRKEMKWGTKFGMTDGIPNQAALEGQKKRKNRNKDIAFN